MANSIDLINTNSFTVLQAEEVEKEAANHALSEHVGGFPNTTFCHSNAHGQC